MSSAIGSGYSSSASLYNNLSQSLNKDAGDIGGGGSAGSASNRAAAVAEATFKESLKAKMISGLYAAAKEIRS